MKKIIYISLLDYYNEDGVSKKIKSQISSFNNLGYRVYFTYLNSEDKMYYLNIGDSSIKLFKDKKSVLLNTIFIYLHLSRILKEKEINYIYIRHTLTNLIEYLFLKRMCSEGTINVIEIPTYPYRDEYQTKSIVDKILLKQDIFLNNKIKKYVDYIVTYSLDKYIFGISCINISNGIDLNRLMLSQADYQKETEVISFTSVSTCYYWHGIDRFLKSLRDYMNNNPTDKVIFNIVGEGDETESLKEYVKNNNLEHIVIFHGFKSGNDLDDIYAKTNIAVGSLGRHRSGVHTMRALKNVEYASKGLPMIFSENDPGFSEVDFVYKVEANEDNFDINRILNWYKSINISPKQITDYCKQFSWEAQMKIVIKVLEEGEINANGNCNSVS